MYLYKNNGITKLMAYFQFKNLVSFKRFIYIFLNSFLKTIVD